MNTIKKKNPQKSFETAVLFLVFNRPNTTKQVFRKISQIKPSKLYIACDGPRTEHEMERKKIEKVRQIVNKIDWPCNLKTLFRDKNLGCKKGVSSAISWFFSYEKQGIILEDDCVPHLDFFYFCENLLIYYSKDKRISAITGNNFQNGRLVGNASYYFSKYTHCWGWATWRRSWKNYDGEIKFWPHWKTLKSWKKIIPNKVEQKYWSDIFDHTKKKFNDSWAYPWIASVWYHNGFTVTPNVNLVSNIGFGKDASHTTIKNDYLSNLKKKRLAAIIHPKLVKIDEEADDYVFEWIFGGRNLRFTRRLASYNKRKIIFFIKMIKND